MVCFCLVLLYLVFTITFVLTITSKVHTKPTIRIMKQIHTQINIQISPFTAKNQSVVSQVSSINAACGEARINPACLASAFKVIWEVGVLLRVKKCKSISQKCFLLKVNYGNITGVIAHIIPQ